MRPISAWLKQGISTNRGNFIIKHIKKDTQLTENNKLIHFSGKSGDSSPYLATTAVMDWNNPDTASKLPDQRPAIVFLLETSYVLRG